VQMLALSNPAIATKLANYKEGLKRKIEKANVDLSEIKYKFKTN